MHFYPYPFLEIPRKKNGFVEGQRKELNRFWETVDEQIKAGLSNAVGCYIFAIRAGKGALPWYIGKAEKQSFQKECFTTHKLYHYNNIIADRKGTPLLLLLPKLTTKGRLAKPSSRGHRDIDFLEKILLSACIQRNPNLSNIKDTKLLREIVVHGFLNNPKGKCSESVSGFKTLLGV